MVFLIANKTREPEKLKKDLRKKPKSIKSLRKKSPED